MHLFGIRKLLIAMIILGRPEANDVSALETKAKHISLGTFPPLPEFRMKQNSFCGLILFFQTIYCLDLRERFGLQRRDSKTFGTVENVSH